MDYSTLIGIHDVEMAGSQGGGGVGGVGTGELDDGPPPASASPTGGADGGAGGGQGGGEPQASAGDGLGEVFEERLFGLQQPQGVSHPTVAGSYPQGGGMPIRGGPDAMENLSDFSPPNSDEYDNIAAGGLPPSGKQATFCLIYKLPRWQ